MEAYFPNNSYKVVQISFWRKFKCCHAPSKSRIFDWIQKFREYGTVQNFNSKRLRDTYSGQNDIPKEECVQIIDNFPQRASLPPTLWRPFGAYFGKN